MKTDDLITRLVDDLPRAPAAPAQDGKRLVLLAVVMVAVTTALSTQIYGLRADGPANGILGLAIWSVLALVGLASATRLRLPDATPWLVVLAPACGFLLLLTVLAMLSLTDGRPLLRIDYVVHCLQTIGLLACAPFVGISILLRRGAPASPMIAGAVAGFIAAVIGTLAYAFSCPISDPLASLSAHAVTVLILAGIGAVLGWRLYAW